jgi:hypothetical protein
MKKELSLSAKIVLGIFFLFTLLNINSGIFAIKFLIESPEESYGAKCLYLAKRKNFTINDFNYIPIRGKSKLCTQEAMLYGKTVNRLDSKIRTIDRVKKEIYELKQKINNLKREYDTTLLEKIANQKEDYSITTSTAEKSKDDIQRYEQKIYKLKKIIEKNSNIKREANEFITFVKSNGNKIVKEYKEAWKKYILLNGLIVFLLLIPLYYLFSYLSEKVSQERYILYSLLDLTKKAFGLTIIFQVVRFFYQILPKTVFEKLFAYLNSLNLTFILNIIGIFFSIFIFYIFLKVVQKYQNRFRIDKCWNCQKKKIDGKFCWNCGIPFYETCKHCSKDKLKKINFCNHCGQK